LAQDSCYQSLLYSQRRQLHSAVAEWIEHEYSDDRSVVYPLLAHHWRLAEDGPRACKYAERAGVQAIRSGAHRAGAAYYSGALALFEAEPEGLAAYVDKERRAHWEGQLGVALHALGDFPRAEDHLLRSLRLRGQPHPRSGAAWGVAALRGAARQVAHRFHLLRLGQRPTLSEPAMAAQRLCEKYFFERQFVPMLGSSLMAVNLAERAGRFENLARSYAMLSVIGGVCRLSPVARSYYRRATEVAEEHDDLPGRVFNGYARCVTLCGTGHFQEGRAAALEVLALSETLGDPQEIEMVHAALANNHYFTGGFERMVEHHAQVRESAQRRGSALHEAWGSYGAALGLIALRRLDEAETLIRQALVLLLESSERVSEHICRGLLADIHLERGNWDDAVEQAELAESLIRQSPPSLFTEIEGYAAVARVRLALWERALASQQADVPSLRARAHRSLSALGQFAFLFPIGRPRRLTLGARALRLDGSRRKARRKARRAIHSAQRLGMPYEEALARRELARSLPVDAAETGAQMGAVDELLADMGCAFSGTELSR
jgi:tetratricopeptide (TPR) repeat protein